MAEDDIPGLEGPVEIDVSVTAASSGIEQPEPEPMPEPDEPVDDGTAALRQQLAYAQQAVQQARQAQQQAERERYQAQRQAQDSHEGSAQAQYDAILNAIAAEQAIAQSAEREMKDAMEAQDADALVAAQTKIINARSNLTQLEDGKAGFEVRAEQMRRRQEQEAAYGQQYAQWQQQQKRQQQRQPSVQEIIRDDPFFISSEKDWLVKHPEAVSNPERRKIAEHAFHQATQLHGLERGSQEYFEFMDKAMGYKKARAERPITVAAPPSRAMTGNVNGSRVTLTGEQRELAKMLGQSEVDFARNVMRYESEKKSGMFDK